MTVITIDFWNTLVNAQSNGELRHQARYKALEQYTKRYGMEVSSSALSQAMKTVSAHFDRIWLGEQRTPLTHELVKHLVEILALPLTEKETAELTSTFQESLHAGPPDLAPDVKSALAELASKYPLGIISDTMFSPGTVLREYLNRQGLLDYFTHFVFSDEMGFSKPNVKAFHRILEASGARADHSWHIGDIQPTDILGANNAGMQSVLYTGISDKYEPGTTATMVLSSWVEIAHQLA